MSKPYRLSCLVCAGHSLEPLISIPEVPTLCNRLYASAAAAADAPRGTIKLCYCRDCGHIVNVSFDSALVNYDGRYENALAFSSRYREFAIATANRLIERYGLHGKRIVEIGCGDAEFLRLLCAIGNHGKGYDPSQPTRVERADAGSFEVIGRDFTAADAVGADFLSCRHVLEHVARPVELLCQLHEGMISAGGGTTYFEVPNALFVLDRLSICDIIYEHVSYFTPSSFARAFHQAGFHIGDCGTGFDDQYLWLEGSLDGSQALQLPPNRPNETLYGNFAARFAERVQQWRSWIEGLQSHNRRAAIWGAGSKGVMFANLLRVSAGEGIDYVVDVNPRKQGHFLPVTRQPIISPESLRQDPPDQIIIMNRHYEAEICAAIRKMGIDCEVLSA